MARTVFGPGPGRLLCDGRVVAAAALADTADSRRKGLLGTDAVEGALWITKCPSVHMMGMRYPIDVAVVDRDGVVIKVATLKPWVGATRPRSRRRRRSRRRPERWRPGGSGSGAGWRTRPTALRT